MKNLLIILSFACLLVLSGCYTQVAVKERETGGRYSSQDEETYQSGGDEYYESESDSESYSYSDGETDITINNYGFYPSHRRYFSSYYPGISIGFYWGSYWYDPFCWDPFYYSYWHSPFIYPVYAYYPGYFYYYPPIVYWGGYYDDYYGGSRYKTRDNDRIALRNGDGLRGPLGSRTITSRTNTILKRDPNQRERITSLNTRSGRTTISNDRTLRNSLRNNETGTRKTDVTGQKREKQNETLGVPKRNTDVREKREQKNDNPVIKRENNNRTKNPQIKKDTRKETQPRIKKDSRTGNNPEVRKNTPPQIRKDNSNPPKSYNPPKRSSNPPKTYSPPRNSSGNSSAPPRTNSGGNRSGGNDSGRRTR